MRSWIRFERPRLAITKNRVAGPGTASSRSCFPWGELSSLGGDPLPAIS